MGVWGGANAPSSSAQNSIFWHRAARLAVEQRRAAQERGFIQRSAGEFRRGGVQSRPRQHPRTRRRVVLAQRSRVSLFGGAVGIRDKCGVLPDDLQIGDTFWLVGESAGGSACKATRPRNRPAAPGGQQPRMHPDVVERAAQMTDAEAIEQMACCA